MKKKALHTLVALACAVLPVIGLAGCQEHEHTFGTEWDSDAGSHWYKATCEHTDAQGDKTPHAYGEWTVVTPATCGVDGLQERECECGHKITAPIAATTAHKWEYKKTVEEATCVTTGKEEQECSVCKATQVAAVAKHNGNLTAVPAKAATCTEAGNIAYWTCADCDTYFYEAEGVVDIKDKASVVIPAMEHEIIEVAAWEAYCYHDGHVAYFECGRCGVFFKDAAGTDSYADKTEVEVKGDHTYKAEYSYDANNHWYDATCLHADVKKDVAAHTLVGGVCDCGYGIPLWISGKMTGAGLEGFNTKVGTNIYFQNAAGEYFEGVVSGAGTDSLTYTMYDEIAAGTYNVYFQNYVAKDVVVSSEEVDVAFTAQDGYVAYRNGGFTVTANGSLLVKDEDNTHEATFPGASFVPSKQVLTIGYTLTGMTTQEANKGGYPLMGMFVGNDNGFWRSVNGGAGDQLIMMAMDDYNSRTYYQQRNQWEIMGEASHYYLFDEKGGKDGGYELQVEYIIDGYDVKIRMKNPEHNQWAWVYGGQGRAVNRPAFNVMNYFSNPVNKSHQTGKFLTEFASTLYKLDEVNYFGISARKDHGRTENANATFSNVYYNVVDKEIADEYSVKGRMIGEGLNGFDTKAGNKIYFKSADGKIVAGEVNADKTYTAKLPVGEYVEAYYLNYTAAIDLEVYGTVARYNVAFNSAKGWTDFTAGGLAPQEDGSLKMKTYGKTTESAIAGASFTPLNQVLTFGYTLTGMTHNAETGGYPWLGMFLGSSNKNLIRLTNGNAGDQLVMMLRDDWASRTGFKQSSIWEVMGTTPVGYYTFGKSDYKLQVEWVIDGYNITLRMKRTGINEWVTVLDKFDVFSYFNNESNISTNGDKKPLTNHAVGLYNLHEANYFGIHARRDADTNGNANITFSDIYYTIEDRA